MAFIPGCRPLVTYNGSHSCGVTCRVNASLNRVLVVGANRGLGLEVARAVRIHGADHLSATAREGRDTTDLQLVVDDVCALDVLDRDAARDIMERTRAECVISCLGGSPTDDNRPDLLGNQILIDAAQEFGVKRFILVSALGAGDSEASVPFQVMHTMRPLLLDKSRAEKYLKNSKLQWTIARPAPLVDDVHTGCAIFTEAVQCYGTITRQDLASLLVRTADSKRAIGKVLTAVDKSRVLLTSPYVRPLEFWEDLPFEEFEL